MYVCVKLTGHLSGKHNRCNVELAFSPLQVTVLMLPGWGPHSAMGLTGLLPAQRAWPAALTGAQHSSLLPATA